MPTPDKHGSPWSIRRNGKARRALDWIGRWKYRLGAIVAGLGASLSYILGTEEIMFSIILWGLVLGVMAGVPALIFEDAIRYRTRQTDGSGQHRVDGRSNGPNVTEQITQSTIQSQREGGSRFRGRQEELATLHALHRRQVNARSEATANLPAGPVLVTIHGKPGVGKSMLSRELVAELAPQYPHGVISENFGTAGGPAPPAEILRRFLIKLGRAETEIPEDAYERARLFRSLTAGKRILFEFDAARSHGQVHQVLPTEPACAVVISSRRDLSAQLNIPPGIALDVPPLEEALEILTAVSRFDWMLQAEYAVEVVELCGRLPSAIVSAAERVLQDGTDLRHVADALRKPASRLSKLDYGGRGVSERYMSEYNRLLERQQQALCLLTLVKSPSFVPWVLVPMLKVDRHEAENVMAALGAAQLLSDAGTDEATGMARYRFNPLVRLFAEERLCTLDYDVMKAQRALDTGYLLLIDQVLSFIYPEYERGHDDESSVPLDAIARRVSEHPQKYVRREYQALLHLVPVALQRNQFELAWRLAALLKGCIPAGETLPDIQDVFGQTIKAARSKKAALAHLDLELSLAAMLVSTENYPAAFKILKAIADGSRGREFASDNNIAVYQTRVVQAQRRIAEAFVQMGDYSNAESWLDAAADTANRNGSSDESKLLQLLSADAYHMADREGIYDHLADGRPLDDLLYFRALIGHSEENRRRGHWSYAEGDLVDAARHSEGDARRMASVHYRLARLYIDHWRSGRPNKGFLAYATEKDGRAQDTVRLPSMAIREAAHSALIFRRMGNLPGAIRARCILARALLTAGKPLAAERLLRTIRQWLTWPELANNPAYPGLLARYSRAYGELQLHRGSMGVAWRFLCHAASRFESSHDFSSNEEIWRLLEVIEKCQPYPVDADLPDVAILDMPHHSDSLTVNPATHSPTRIPKPRARIPDRETSPEYPED